MNIGFLLETQVAVLQNPFEKNSQYTNSTYKVTNDFLLLVLKLIEHQMTPARRLNRILPGNHYVCDTLISKEFQFHRFPYQNQLNNSEMSICFSNVILSTLDHTANATLLLFIISRLFI